MKIGILGTGAVGRAIAARCAELGHEVVLGTRELQRTLDRTDIDAEGALPFATWLTDNGDVALATLHEAAADSELIVNATNGAATMAALAAAGADGLDHKPLLELANPLDFSAGFPPRMAVEDTDSLAEQVQRAYPSARVVKTLNTMSNTVMIRPEALGAGDHTVFVAGDDDEAKATVAGLLREFGWRDVLDLGDLAGARGMEHLLPLWLRLYGVFGTGDFNIKVVR